MSLPGSEFYRHSSLGVLERWYCRLFGIPIVGLRIRVRILTKLLPANASRILDAGCGRGVISRILARRYHNSSVDAVDENAAAQEVNKRLARVMKLENCHFITDDLLNLSNENYYDLIVSVDNLEHVQDDIALLKAFYNAILPAGFLVLHVPHYFRRWPICKWRKNFDVPGHVRPGYHLPEITERVRRAGFDIVRSGFSYNFFENLVNNLSYAITGAQEKNKIIYAILFPFLNFIAWAAHWKMPRLGAGVWVIAKKTPGSADVSKEDAHENEDG